MCWHSPSFWRCACEPRCWPGAYRCCGWRPPTREEQIRQLKCYLDKLRAELEAVQGELDLLAGQEPQPGATS